MKTHHLEINSSFRNINTYPQANTYVVSLSRPLYNVSRIELLSGQIPKSQLLIHSRNNVLRVNTFSVSLTTNSYSNGYTLASELQRQLVGSRVNVVQYVPTRNSLIFSNATASNRFYMDFTNNIELATILGFLPSNIVSTSNIIESGAINLSFPPTLSLHIMPNDSRSLDRDIFVISSNVNPLHGYTFNIMSTLDPTGTFIALKNTEDLCEYNFNKGSEDMITDFRFIWYYNTGNQLLPYDFRNANHSLKFRITCQIDKFQAITKNENAPLIVPPPVLEYPDRVYVNEDMYTYAFIFFIVLFGIWILFIRA